MSPKRSRSTRAKPSLAASLSPPVARAGGAVLCSATVGALPVVNRLLCRTRLEEFLRDALPKEDGRTKLSPTKALLVLVRNLLLSREPIYGLGEWAARFAPDLLGLNENEVGLLNDDRVGRALDKLFAADVPSLVLAVASHVVKEFGLRLDELHNDSTSVSFFGAYLDASMENRVLGRPTLAITFGHSKDHRPDAAQRSRILASLPRRPRLPLADRPARARPLRANSASHVHSWQTTRPGSAYRFDPRPTPSLNTARSACQTLWPMTCRAREIQRKSHRDVRKMSSKASRTSPGSNGCCKARRAAWRAASWSVLPRLPGLTHPSETVAPLAVMLTCTPPGAWARAFSSSTSRLMSPPAMQRTETSSPRIRGPA